MSGNLGPGKAFYNKLSIKAKAELDPWAQRVSSGQATWWQLWSSMLFYRATGAFHDLCQAFATPSRRPTGAPPTTG